MKKVIIFFCFVVLLVIVFSVYHSHIEKAAESELYVYLSKNLCDYPTMYTPYCASLGYYKSNGEGYLLIQNQGEYVTGRQSPSGIVEFYHNGKAYKFIDSELIETCDADSDYILEVFRSGIISLFEDKTVTYTYHKPSGRDLPIWVSPLDSEYLLVERGGYADYTETMIYSNSGSKAIRWSIAKSEKDTELYLRIAEQPVSAFKTFIPGWGEIPEVVFDLLDCGIVSSGS